MRRLVLLAVLLTASTAVAQTPAPADPSTAPAAPAATQVETERAAPALEQAWTTEDTTSTRFEGERVLGPTFRAGAEVVVLFRDGDAVRVADGNSYGWVDAGKLTSTPPAASPTTIELTPSAP